jgi:LysM domain
MLLRFVRHVYVRRDIHVSTLIPAARMAESGGDRETANFNARFRQIDANYPSAAPSTYTAVKGDNLISVARAVWGDGSLWYLIADANGLSSPDSLTDGQSLVIPNKVANINNNATTFAPYDPSKIIGDTTPATPPPPPPSASNGGDKCGGFGQVLVIVVAVAVTIASAGAGAAFASTLGLTAGSTAATAVAAATAAAIGNVAAQATANVVGIQNGFDIRQTLFAAGTAGITQGALGNFGGASASLGDQIIRGAASSVINQGIRIATGLQSSFSWAQVAGSAIAAPIVNGLTDRLLGEQSIGLSGTPIRQDTAFTEAFGRTAANVITNALAGTVSQVIVTRFTGGKLNYANIAADAFGNAIANGIGEDIGYSIAAEQQRGRLEEARMRAAARSDFMAMAQNRPSSIEPLIPTQVDINLPPLPDLNVVGNVTNANNTRLAQRGDSYARMARDAYGDERYALALAQYNGARNSTLQLGARVELPDFDRVDLRRGGDFLANDAAMRQAASNRAPVDPTDGMRAGPTLARLASQNAASASANAPTLGELITSLQPYSDLQRMGAVDYRLANPVNMVPEARSMTDESSLRGRLIESMRSSSLGESNAGQVAIGALNRYLTLGESSVGALFNLPGNAYSAIEEKGIGRAALDGYNGALTGVRQSFFNVAYGLNGESRGALAFDLMAGAGAGVAVRSLGLAGVNGVTMNSGGDRLIGTMGPARINNVAEYNAIVKDLKANGVDISYREGQFAYGPAPSGGRPGNIVFDPDASLSAVKHEYGHFLDDAALGFPGQRYYYENPSMRLATERSQYLNEIRTARELGDTTARRQLIQDYLSEKKYLIDNYYTKPYGSK